ncbi:MAG: GSCFA domain-containing protein [Bacteroidota bacterium]|nr:GSCFA domain-containing protein [Bacteroidota bacterium]MDP4214749.1 GSCFA domain-containing protein [Bacteroidota bacterium]MDP4253304.1 GSCFA domain-containing protein [Bacteroidota bacterium]MDP4257662.1 GSCFA domain-containing protein [Bacteroidota bacterium]
MEFQLPIRIDSPTPLISYRDKILLTGSCFTEHIGNTLQELKFDILQNPHGILFDPASVASSLASYIDNRQYGPGDLVHLNELWQSWQHHGVFSHIDKDACLARINESQSRAHAFLKNAKWLIVTLGSAFSYRLTETDLPVANCHRAPAQSFRKHLMSIDEIIEALDSCFSRLFRFNPGIQVILTVSPVRHIRDGVIENNCSKARLIEAVHHLVAAYGAIRYFPAYELVIDVLRDYRFYDIDMVHPNYQATTFVLEKFAQHVIDEPSRGLMDEVRKIVIARKHRPLQPSTLAHKRFLQEQELRTRELGAKFPFLDLAAELEYFSAGSRAD